MYVAAIALILIISILLYLFLVVSFVAGVIAVGENVDDNSRHSTSKFPCFLYLLLGVLLRYPYFKMVEFHHPGF